MQELDQEEELGYGGASAELSGYLQGEDGKLLCLSVCVLLFKY